MNQSTHPFPPLSRPASHGASDRGVVVSGRVGTAAPRSISLPTPRNVRLAQALFENTYRVWPIDIQESEKPFGLVVEDESCALCGGFFPRVGQLRGFYAEDGTFNLVHIGCLVEVGNWVER